jgi:hypothetical protein
VPGTVKRCHAARTALPVVAAERQQVMAVGVLTSERVIADLAPLSAASSDRIASRRRRLVHHEPLKILLESC